MAGTVAFFFFFLFFIDMNKIIYICHPVSADVKGNMDKIVQIAREINLSEPNICPIAPYVLELMALDDKKLSERNRGVRNGIYLFERGFFDEVWLYGDHISKGMRYEIMVANEKGIPVVPKSDAMKRIFLESLASKMAA